MKKLLILLIAFTFTQELEVDGDLKVTGNIQNDSLAQVIAVLQAQVSALQIQALQFECINTGVIADGYCDCYGNILNICGDCGGDVINEEDCFVFDYDGNGYNTVEIGDQRWMSENLKTTKYSNGSPISNNDYYYYEDSIVNKEIYGALYRGEVINNPSGEEICMDGWHIPTDLDWQELEIYLGMPEEWADDIGWRSSGNVGNKLKNNESGWVSDYGTNESGFSALGAGLRDASANFTGLNYDAYFWTNTYSETEFIIRMLRAQDGSVYRGYTTYDNGCSIRCIQD